MISENEKIVGRWNGHGWDVNIKTSGPVNMMELRLFQRSVLMALRMHNRNLALEKVTKREDVKNG